MKRLTDGRILKRIAAVSIIACAFAVAGPGSVVASPAPEPLAPLRQASPSASPVPTDTIAISGLVDHPGSLSVTDLQRLPTETVAVTYQGHDGEERHTFTGVRLFALLDRVGVTAAPDERNPLLHRYLIVTANDGYQVLLSGGELDPNFGDAPILLAWQQDGRRLTGEDGPLRLVVPGDIHGGRYVHGIVQIEVDGINDPPRA